MLMIRLLSRERFVFGAVLIGWCLFCPGSSSAQVVANGTNQTASGTTTTAAAGVPGYGLYALNGGTINGLGVVTVTATGANAYAVAAFSAGEVTLSSGATITTNSTGLYASGSGSEIDVTNGTVRLNAANAVGAQAQLGANVALEGGTVTTISTGANANGQTGLLANGTGSSIEANGTFIDLTPTGTTSNMRGVVATAGGQVDLSGNVELTGGGNGVSNYALVSSGAGSEIEYSGTATTASRGSFAVLAEDGGHVVLNDGTVIGTTGLHIVASSTGSHALYATGAGSEIEGTGVTGTTTGTMAQGARAESGGLITLSDGSLSTSGAGSATVFASAAAAIDGGELDLDGMTLSTTGQFAHALYGTGAGSTIDFTDGTITVTGPRSNGVQLSAGAIGTVSGSQITVSQALGVLVDGGSALTLDETDIDTTGSNAIGLSVTGTGSTVTMTGGSIDTQGAFAIATQASLGGVLTLNDVAISSTGNGKPYGAYAGLDGFVTINGGTIDTYGDATDPSTANARRPEGIVAQGANALAEAFDTVVHTRGIEAFAIVADDGGTVNLEGVDVLTDGYRGIGLYAITDQPVVNSNTINAAGITVVTTGELGHGAMASQMNYDPLATVNLSEGSTIETQGVGASGLRATLKGTVNAIDTTVDTSGLNAYGMIARDNGSSVNIEETTVTTTGAAAHGAVAERGGLVTGVSATVAASGINASALLVAGEPGFVSAAEFTDSELTNSTGATIGVAGSGNVELIGSTVGGSGQWLLVGTTDDFPALLAVEPALLHRTDEEIEGDPLLALPPQSPLAVVAGLANITATGSTMTGSAITMAGSVSNVTMEADTLWNLTGNSNLTYLLNDLSLIDFSAPVGDPLDLASYKTLTVNNYVGDAGLIALNTYLGTDGSPSDLLIIDTGTATGSTGLIIDNTTGPGAVTNGNGILVVEALNGATTPGSFSLADEVVAGPYEYFLYYGSVDETGPENWYLRSTLNCGLVDPPVDPCPDPDPDPDPHYRQEVPLVVVLPALMDFYGRNLIDTLHERVGENAPPHPGTIDVGDSAKTPFWGRVMGNVGRHQGDPMGVYGDGPTFDYAMGAVQAGVDLHHEDNEDGSTDRAGVFGAVGTAFADVTHNLKLLDAFDAGRSSLGAYSLGGYWTHYEEEGAYVDAVVAGTFYTLGIDSGRRAADTTGWGVAGSLEMGRPYDLGNDWLIEPQVQVIGQWFGIDDLSEGAADVAYSDLGSLLGRLGFRLAHDFTLEADGNDMPASAWLRGNLWHQFIGQPTAEFSSEEGPVPFTADLRDTWVEIGVGSDLRLNEAQSFYTALNVQSNLEGTSLGASGRLGLKGVW